MGNNMREDTEQGKKAVEQIEWHSDYIDKAREFESKVSGASARALDTFKDKNKTFFKSIDAPDDADGKKAEKAWDEAKEAWKDVEKALKDAEKAMKD